MTSVSGPAYDRKINQNNEVFMPKWSTNYSIQSFTQFKFYEYKLCTIFDSIKADNNETTQFLISSLCFKQVNLWIFRGSGGQPSHAMSHFCNCKT